MASDRMKVAGLGRPFCLGMLYDARKDELIPGFSLWDDKHLQDHTKETRQESSRFEVSASDSTQSKCSLLNIEASLKASFLSGLIEVEGSAKYLNDQKKFKNQSRVTFQYKATTSFKELSMTDLGTADEQQRGVIEKSSATHVVTGILYGANAFFVFDSERVDASTVQDIQGSMQAVIKKIPSFDVGGKVEIKLSDEEKDLVNKFSCKFYGDVILESNPATFEQAVKAYVELPKLFGENSKNSVPVMVWLISLKNFDSKAAELVREVSVGLVRNIEDTLEDLKKMEERCNDSLVDAADEFPEIRNQLRQFLKLYNYYTTKLKQTVAEKLPSIREGKEDERSLNQLFKDRDESPFSHAKLSKWLDYKEREINVIRSCLQIMEGIKIVQNQSELDREVLAPGAVQSLCFIFTSLESADPCLDAMAAYLDSLLLVKRANEEPWFYSDQVLTEMRAKARKFKWISEKHKQSRLHCFLVAAISNKKYVGAAVYYYLDGVLKSEDFNIP